MKLTTSEFIRLVATVINLIADISTIDAPMISTLELTKDAWKSHFTWNNITHSVHLYSAYFKPLKGYLKTYVKASILLHCHTTSYPTSEH